MAGRVRGHGDVVGAHDGVRVRAGGDVEFDLRVLPREGGEGVGEEFAGEVVCELGWVGLGSRYGAVEGWSGVEGVCWVLMMMMEDGLDGLTSCPWSCRPSRSSGSRGVCIAE